MDENVCVCVWWGGVGCAVLFPIPDFQVKKLSALRISYLTIKSRCKEVIKDLFLFLILSNHVTHHIQ